MSRTLTFPRGCGPERAEELFTAWLDAKSADILRELETSLLARVGDLDDDIDLVDDALADARAQEQTANQRALAWFRERFLTP